MLSKTFYIHAAHALTPAFRSVMSPYAAIYNSGMGASGSALIDEPEELGLGNSYSRYEPREEGLAVSVMASFTSVAIIADIFHAVEQSIKCKWSMVFDSNDITDEHQKQPQPWHNAQCLLILGHQQPVTESVFNEIIAYAKRGGTVIYWGDVAPNSESQFQLIGAWNKGEILEPGEPHIMNLNRHPDRSLLNGVRDFKSVGKLIHYSSLARDCNALMGGKIQKYLEPVVWTRNIGDGKLFYSSLSEDADWLDDTCIALMTNAIKWAAEK